MQMLSLCALLSISLLLNCGEHDGGSANIHVFGAPIPADDFEKIAPYIGQMVFSDPLRRYSYPECSVVFIDESTALTALHCLTQRDSQQNIYGFLRDKRFLSITGEKIEAPIGVKSYRIYNPLAGHLSDEQFARVEVSGAGPIADLAVIELERPIPYKLKPMEAVTDLVRIRSTQKISGSLYAIALGYGLVPGPSHSCENQSSSLGATKLLVDNIDANWLLPGQVEFAEPEISGICPGDSGGGVFVEENGVFKLLAINSTTHTGSLVAPAWDWIHELETSTSELRTDKSYPDDIAGWIRDVDRNDPNSLFVFQFLRPVLMTHFDQLRTGGMLGSADQTDRRIREILEDAHLVAQTLETVLADLPPWQYITSAPLFESSPAGVNFVAPYLRSLVITNLQDESNIVISAKFSENFQDLTLEPSYGKPNVKNVALQYQRPANSSVLILSGIDSVHLKTSSPSDAPAAVAIRKSNDAMGILHSVRDLQSSHEMFLTIDSSTGIGDLTSDDLPKTVEFLGIIGTDLRRVEDLSSLTSLSFLDLSYNDMIDVSGLQSTPKSIAAFRLFGEQSKEARAFAQQWKPYFSAAVVDPVEKPQNLYEWCQNKVAFFRGSMPVTTLYSARTAFGFFIRLAQLAFGPMTFEFLNSKPTEELCGEIAKMSDIEELNLRSYIPFVRPGYDSFSYATWMRSAEATFIEDLDGLQFFKQLRILNLSENHVRDLSPLRALHNLEELYLSRNRLESLSPLAKLYRLRVLYVSDNRVSNLESLRGLLNLREFQAFRNRITSIPWWFSEREFDSLNISENPITSP